MTVTHQDRVSVFVTAVLHVVLNINFKAPVLSYIYMNFFLKGGGICPPSVIVMLFDGTSVRHYF